MKALGKYQNAKNRKSLLHFSADDLFLSGEKTLKTISEIAPTLIDNPCFNHFAPVSDINYHSCSDRTTLTGRWSLQKNPFP